ncbi:MAG: hypothetical protein K2J64_07830, partial [Desulfovibrio sp.]|nr:hypothetical protein [Desulfovibrio sp.]
AACEALGIEREGREKWRAYRPLRMPGRSGSPSFAPRGYPLPPEKWRAAATKIAWDAYLRLGQSPMIQKYLAKRGLPPAAADKYGLGYIEGEGNAGDSIFRPRVAFGLPEKSGRDGRPVRAFRVPRGITIPVWSGYPVSEKTEVLRIRIRRRNVDLDRANPKDPKYLLVPQPGQAYSAPLLLPPSPDISPQIATWVIVESELDAMAVHHACEGRVGVISILSVRVKPDVACHAALAKSARILVALDADEDKPDGSNPGAEAWPWWRQTYPQARLWPVPVGKDPGEAFALGVDLAEWIAAATPSSPAGLSSAALSPQGSGEPRSGAQQAPRRLQASPNPAQGRAGEGCARGSSGRSKKEVVTVAGCGQEQSPRAAGAKECRREQGYQCWQIPADVRTWADLTLPTGKISKDELLRAFRHCGTDNPDCLLPCPRTEPTFWWGYLRDCPKCRTHGHPLCLRGLVHSPLFQEALKNA